MSLPEDADINAVFSSLRGLDQVLLDGKVNTNDRAIMLISACIAEGFDTANRIVGVLGRLGFNRRHVGLMLKHGLQRTPEWPNWGRHYDGTYFVPDRALT